MIRRLRRQKLAAARNCTFTAVVGIRWRALAFFAAVRSLLIELATREAVERPHEQKYCQEGDGNENVTTQSPQVYLSIFDRGHHNNHSGQCSLASSGSMSTLRQFSALGGLHRRAVPIGSAWLARQHFMARGHPLGPLSVISVLVCKILAMVDSRRAELR